MTKRLLNLGCAFSRPRISTHAGSRDASAFLVTEEMVWNSLLECIAQFLFGVRSQSSYRDRSRWALWWGENGLWGLQWACWRGLVACTPCTAWQSGGGSSRKTEALVAVSPKRKIYSDERSTWASTVKKLRTVIRVNTAVEWSVERDRLLLSTAFPEDDEALSHPVKVHLKKGRSECNHPQPHLHLLYLTITFPIRLILDNLQVSMEAKAAYVAYSWLTPRELGGQLRVHHVVGALESHGSDNRFSFA